MASVSLLKQIQNALSPGTMTAWSEGSLEQLMADRSGVRPYGFRGILSLPSVLNARWMSEFLIEVSCETGDTITSMMATRGTAKSLTSEAPTRGTVCRHIPVPGGVSEL